MEIHRIQQTIGTNKRVVMITGYKINVKESGGGVNSTMIYLMLQCTCSTIKNLKKLMYRNSYSTRLVRNNWKNKW
jgi:hypothetical protein